MQQIKNEDRTFLVHWTYSREEWNKFILQKKKEQGWFIYLVHLAGLASKPASPVVSVSHHSVMIDGKDEAFIDASRKLTRINISEKHNMNVLEIDYLLHDFSSGEVRLLVPRGKLKEAIQLEEILNQIKITQPGYRL